MPKKLPGVTLEYNIVSDAGNVVTARLRMAPKLLPLRIGRAVAKSLLKLEKADLESAAGPTEVVSAA